MNILKLFLTFLFLFIGCIPSFGLVITHPESKIMTVDENGIFFSGKINKYEKVFINGIEIYPEKRGAFSYSVPLKIGENIFAVQKKDWGFNSETHIYKITRLSLDEDINKDKFIEHTPKYYETIKDDVVLRSTPIDAGMNRLGYLPIGTKIFVDGIENEFSRVYLTKDKFGWVMTKDIKDIENNSTNENSYTPKSIICTDCIKTDNDITYTFSLSENCPYSVIAENNKLIISIYNIDNSDELYKKIINLEKNPRYSVCMKNNLLYAKIKNSPYDKENYSNKKVKIVIDPGHGGDEIGAVGCLGDKEKNINLDVALKLKEILQQHNFDVYMTRQSDKYVSLNDRVKYGRDTDAMLFVSIHMNSVPISSNPNLNQGTIVFYFNPQSKNLAQSISKKVSQSLKTVDGGSTQASYAVIRPTEYLGVLVELAYLVNPKDVSIYKNRHFTQKSALAIYQGIVNYLHSSI